MSVWGELRKKSLGEESRLEHSGEFISVEDMPWEEMADTIAEMMKKGIVHFVYKKKDSNTKKAGFIAGEERDAWGTKKMDIVDKIPHGGECPPKRVGYTTYFDCKKNGWRVYWDGRLLGYYDAVYTYGDFLKLSEE